MLSKKLAVILIILLLLVPLLTDIRYHYFYRPEKTIHNSLINSIKYKTGDIVAHTWRNDSLFDINKVHKYKFNLFKYLREILPNIINGQTSHISIIICLNDVPYVYDLSGYGDYFYDKNPKLPIPKFCNFSKSVIYDDCPALLDIKYLKYYGGHINILPYIGAKPNESDILSVLNKNKNINLRVASSILNKCIINNNNYDKNKMSCSAFTAKILTELNLVVFKNHYCVIPQSVVDTCIKSGKYDCKNTIFIDNDY